MYLVCRWCLHFAHRASVKVKVKVVFGEVKVLEYGVHMYMLTHDM